MSATENDTIGCVGGIVGILIGLVIIGFGVIVGNSTYQKPYQQVTAQTLKLYVSGSASDGYISYIELEGSTAIYLVHEKDFTPELSYDALGGGRTLMLAFIPDNPSQVDVTTSNGLEIKGAAYQVVSLTVQLDSQTKQFTTSDYTDHPGGYPQDHWGIGRWIVGVGIVILGIVVWVVLAMNGIVITPDFS